MWTNWEEQIGSSEEDYYTIFRSMVARKVCGVL